MTIGGALNDLNNLLNADDIPCYYKPSIKAVMDTIALSSSKNPNKWISVSERLPEEFESVLVCYKSQGGMAQCVSERIVNIDGGNFWSAMCGQEPIAWMSLPNPYKVEKEEE